MGFKSNLLILLKLKTISVLLFILSIFNSFAQKKLYLKLIPTDSNAINILKKQKQQLALKDSILLFNYLTNLKISNIQKGYASFSIDSIIKIDSLFKAYIFAGLKYELNDLRFKNIDNKAIKSLKLKNTKSLNISKLEAIEQKIAYYYENIGYPFVKIKFHSIEFENQQISGTLEAIKGDRLYIDSIIIKGKPKISNKFLLNYISIKKGEVYNQSKIDDIEKNIEKLTFITQVKHTEIEFITNKADIYLYLKDKNANFFSGIIGFKNKEETKNKIFITGDLKVTLNNTFKIAEKIDIYWIKYNENSQNLDFSIKLPYLFFLPIGFENTFNLEKHELDYLTTSFKSNVTYNFSDHNNIVKFYYTNKQSFIINTDSVDNDVLSDFNNYSLGISFEFDKTDNQINPTQGSSFLFSSALGNRTNSTTGNNSYIELKFNATYYFKLTNIFTFSIENNSAGMFSDVGFYENEI